MLLFSHGGVLPSDAAKAPNDSSKDCSRSVNLKSEILLPHSSSVAIRQPQGDDASAAIPVAPAITTTSSSNSSISGGSCGSRSRSGSRRSSSSARSFMSSTFCQRGSSTNSPHSPTSVAVRNIATDIRMGTEPLCAAVPAAGKREETRFSRFLSRVFAAAASNRRACQQQLLLPCLLGDPFVCLNVDRRVGVAAGTLLGRLSLFYSPTDAAAASQQQQPRQQQQQEQQEDLIRGEVLLPQAYSDDGVAMCWTDTTYLTAVIGAADLVQWKLPSLRCMGSEQLSLFANRSAFNSVTMNMRLLRRCRESGQLLLLYRHCSSDLAAMILCKLQQQPNSQDASALPLTEEQKKLQKEWACALAAGVCTLDEKQQQQQLQFTPTHSACLLGTGAACIMDLTRRSYMEEYLVHRQAAPRRLQQACFSSHFFLVVAGDKAISVFDLRLSFFKYYASRARVMGLCSSKTAAAAEAAAAAFSCCAGTCENYKGTDAQQQQQHSSVTASGSGSTSRLLRRQGGLAASPEGWDSQRPEGPPAPAGAAAATGGGAAAESPLRSLPLLFLRCLQNSAAVTPKEKSKAKLLQSNLFRRLVGSVAGAKNKEDQSSAPDEVAPGAAAAPAAAAAADWGAHPSESPNADGSAAAEEDELLLHAVDGEEAAEGVHPSISRSPDPPKQQQQKHQQQQHQQQDAPYPFFLFERTPLAFRVADAFFRFCSLLLQQQRQQQQRSSLYTEEAAAAAGATKPPEPSHDKPFVSICWPHSCLPF
ncbi:uncharacterized protein EMH_0011250 [Eimeria mitis]|uniref:Uncharacterized protein n=1 Tax=Eimeria mitis TaxID=44415 RepID=U6K783_9EIME|nr:uncharacterized protein EMH_0011250 [Eimeria mitis]CDJ32072.1 hypothetical protein, conserved [Eimeria mitis]